MQAELGVFFEYVRDRSPFEVDAYRQRGWARASQGLLQATAFAALEHAQWDLAGKALDAPVAELLDGGSRLRTGLPTYANINRATVDRTPEGFAANAQAAVADRFDGIKAAVFDDFPPLTAQRDELDAAKELGIARAEAIREVIGPDIALMIDVHSHFDVPLAIEVAERFEPLNLEFYEEPVPPENLADTLAIRAAIQQQLAGGESLFGRDSFEPLCRDHALDIVCRTSSTAADSARPGA
jgi:galactonate dehydratase